MIELILSLWVALVGISIVILAIVVMAYVILGIIITPIVWLVVELDSLTDHFGFLKRLRVWFLKI